MLEDHFTSSPPPFPIHAFLAKMRELGSFFLSIHAFWPKTREFKNLNPFSPRHPGEGGDPE